jgi:hypothetical protein
MIRSWGWVALLAAPGLLIGQNYTAPTVSDKLEAHASWVAGPYALASTAFGAGLLQLRNEPPEWRQGAAGYGRRFASLSGYLAVQNAIALGIDTSLRQDPRFRKSLETRFWPRAKDAISQTFIAHTDSGRRAFNYWEVGGNYGAGLISSAWYPSRYNSIGDGLIRGTVGLGYDALANVVKEFWPGFRKRRKAMAGSAGVSGP